MSNHRKFSIGRLFRICPFPPTETRFPPIACGVASRWRAKAPSWWTPKRVYRFFLDVFRRSDVTRTFRALFHIFSGVAPAICRAVNPGSFNPGRSRLPLTGFFGCLAASLWNDAFRTLFNNSFNGISSLSMPAKSMLNNAFLSMFNERFSFCLSLNEENSIRACTRRCRGSLLNCGGMDFMSSNYTMDTVWRPLHV